jgi:hypothetical protein
MVRTAHIEATPGPTFGGGYRVRIMDGGKQVATRHFPVPPDHRNYMSLTQGLVLAYKTAKQWCDEQGCD